MFGAVLKYRGAVPKIAAKRRNVIYKEGFTLALTFWHFQFRPKHFTHAGAREYKYTPRKGESGSGRKFKGSYTARKLKQFGHTRPLEYSGTSKALSSQQNIKATSKGGRAIIRAPALNFRHPNSEIRMRDEMTRVSDAERQKLATQYETYVTAGFNRLTESETKTV